MKVILVSVTGHIMGEGVTTPKDPVVITIMRRGVLAGVAYKVEGIKKRSILHKFEETNYKGEYLEPGETVTVSPGSCGYFVEGHWDD